MLNTKHRPNMPRVPPQNLSPAAHGALGEEGKAI